MCLCHLRGPWARRSLPAVRFRPGVAERFDRVPRGPDRAPQAVVVGAGLVGKASRTPLRAGRCADMIPGSGTGCRHLGRSMLGLGRAGG